MLKGVMSESQCSVSEEAAIKGRLDARSQARRRLAENVDLKLDMRYLKHLYGVLHDTICS